MADHVCRCRCGCTPPHADPLHCDRNRATTKEYMARIRSHPVDAASAIAAGHDDPGNPHLRPRYGCPCCPIGSQLERAAIGAPWAPITEVPAE